ncbi:MAG: Major facilitator superfamily [candidate division WS6 bacterium GW2011_GWC1_36_11]|uniref:Major facilitator superfamily n=2 Tax=Candidatus Dojkabacteria TaxID=74243 RepID=A0A0G0D746_9BACT|nr:MAG: Major facilitator superfamily [candidate division WS6 bacterium GW2011_GWC1_36_11]KKQ02901.1 MAG: Major facilitator superfamily [candidate division WS6 bacterium GW2011_WS6_36_26]KKQ16887.1 MAG: Major facilitator superfamily [candidate division WS6 bacterium GW2011_GWF1_36_8]
MKKIFAWPKEIYLFWIVDFILGLELIGSVLLIFFRDWGGLNQTQTQMLQSWFTLWIFILEIPTGVFGDVVGKKKSVLIGYILTIIGTITYSIVPNIWLFLLSEFIFAAGIAFISGSKEAWMYGIAEKYNIQSEFKQIYATAKTFNIIGMIVASVIFIYINTLLPVQQIFRLGIFTNLLVILLLGFLIKPAQGGKKKRKPTEVAKEAFQLLKSNITLRKLAIYTGLLGSTSYFVIWLYQQALRVLSVDDIAFGEYRIVLLGSQLLVLRLFPILFKKLGLKKVLILIAIIVGLGFIIGGVLHNTIGILFVLAFSGGLGLQVSTLVSDNVNNEIEEDQRSTVLSFVNMARRLMLTVFNPVIGFLVDTKGVFIAFTVLGVISLLAIFFKPKIISK